MSDILSTLSNAIYPGQRVLRFAGWEGLKKFHMPRDSEVIGLDVDPTKSYVYMKKVDGQGNEFCGRYSYYEDPVEEFTPGAYVRKSDFDKLPESTTSRRQGSKQPHKLSFSSSDCSDYLVKNLGRIFKVFQHRKG